MRAIAAELDSPVTILQDLQGPKVRVGQLPGGEIALVPDQIISLVPEQAFDGQPATVPIDYPHAAQDARPGMQILFADGLFELQVVEVAGPALRCRVVEGGVLQNRKGVNFPNLDLRLPSMTEKDILDLEFGLAQKVDWISLSFVRSAADVRELKSRLAAKGAHQPVIAKIEKPQAIERLDEILAEVDGVMVARGDLGVELSPERVPMLQKRIIEQCNRRGIPVITATQMLESMIHDPRPTRAEASDVANAIIDGTDAIMLSGESAIGAFPVSRGGDDGADRPRSGRPHRLFQLPGHRRQHRAGAERRRRRDREDRAPPLYCGSYHLGPHRPGGGGPPHEGALRSADDGSGGLSFAESALGHPPYPCLGDAGEF